MIAVTLLALGLVLVVEGLAWVLAPSLVLRLLATLSALPEAVRRQIGALSLVTGLILLWLAHLMGLSLAV